MVDNVCTITDGRRGTMNQTALITGASRGIGKATAIAFAKEGYDLVLTCIRSEEQLLALKQELEQTYPISCSVFIGDMGDFTFVQSVFASLRHLDVLINNAGISYIGLLQDMEPDTWHQIIRTNLDAVFYTCKSAVNLMLPQKRGNIINISSVWGNRGASMEVAYSASKGGVNAFTQALAKELAPSGIAVNAVACGVIDTDMNRCFTEEERQMIIDSIPADRMGQSSEIADVILKLVQSPSYLTGQIITVDGGYL